MKRIVSIQDLSCVGKCSLGVALPVLSVMGLECVALPTALLSAHTAFDGFYSRDLTDTLAPILAHWKKLELHFDAVYSGYLGSCAQVQAVQALFDAHPAALHFADPAMGDHGRLYSGVDPALSAEMRRLCSRASVITPNLTEASLLTGLAYEAQPSDSEVQKLLDALLALGVPTAMITGIRRGDGKIRVAVAERSGVRFCVENEDVPGVYHGTGDLFASVCAGAMTRGVPTAEAVKLAAQTVSRAIAATRAAPDARWYGVQFESCLAELPALVRENIREENLR